tara:strand:- start:272 stop:484 length:213 start_codon:yes stop_codon:yes gene_type:complete
MLTYIKSNKPNIMEPRRKFKLMTKPSFQGERGDIINTCEAHSLTEAIQIFAKIKQLRPDKLVELFKVHQQ